MDIQQSIQLGEKEHVDGVNVDTSMKIELASQNTLMLEYDIQNILDVTQVFDDERQNIDTYRLHGEIEYFSLLNYLKKDYEVLEDFFAPINVTASTKSLLTDFKFYLVKPSTGFTELITDERYIKNYTVIGDISNIEIIKIAYSVNIFNERQYAFIFNSDVNLTGLRDGLNFPITEIAIYAEYQPSVNGNSVPETMERKIYNTTGGTIITSFTPTPLTDGDDILGNVIDYNKIQFLQTDFNIQEYRIYTTYNDGSNKELRWKYNPFIPITLRVFEDNVQTINSGSTSVEDVAKIPNYATLIDSQGNFVWRNLQDKGFFDPLTNIGVNFPFINQRHYVFQTIIVSVVPDLTHANTSTVFNEISFGANTLIKAKPNSSLDNIGKLCS